MDEVYILFSTAENNETCIEAVTTERLIAERWEAHRGHHFETYGLNDLSAIQWAIKE